MTDPVFEALLRAVDDPEVARLKRVRDARRHADVYRFGDPSRFVPGQIDNRAKRKKERRKP